MRRFPSKTTLFIITINLLLFLYPPALSKGGDLFSKIGIQAIRDREKAPDFYLESLTGEKVQLKSLKGKVIFLNFWATWCGPCKEEMPSMEALCQGFKDKGFAFLTISLDYEGRKTVKKFMEKQQYDFPVLLDPTSKTLQLFQVSRIPTTVIIDRGGRMIGRVIGPRDWYCPDVLALIDQLLNKPSERFVSLRD